MILKQFNTAREFVDRNLDYLEKEEATNGLLTGIALSSVNAENDQTLFFNIENEKGIQFAAVKSLGRNIVVYGEVESFDVCAKMVLDYLDKENVEIPGVIGPKTIATKLTDLYKEKTGRGHKVNFNFMVFRLDEVEHNPVVTGTMRLCNGDDQPLIERWMHEFQLEANRKDDFALAVQTAKQKIQQGEVYLWEDERAVTMACTSRPTRHGTTINFVYTPIKDRANGYATKLVSELSQEMLSSGYEFCTLFTDLSNPTSNSIYKKIGYKEVQAFMEIEFD